MNNKGYTSLELFGIISIFSAIYLVSMFNMSYAFETNFNEVAYDETLSIIKLQSEVYASLNEELFQDSDSIYFYVEDLINNDLLKVDNNGDFLDPTNSNNSLNNLKIKVVLDDTGYSASIIKI